MTLLSYDKGEVECYLMPQLTFAMLMNEVKDGDKELVSVLLLVASQMASVSPDQVQ